MISHPDDVSPLRWSLLNDGVYSPIMFLELSFLPSSFVLSNLTLS